MGRGLRHEPTKAGLLSIRMTARAAATPASGQLRSITCFLSCARLMPAWNGLKERNGGIRQAQTKYSKLGIAKIETTSRHFLLKIALAQGQDNERGVAKSLQVVWASNVKRSGDRAGAPCSALPALSTTQASPRRQIGGPARGVECL